jgi:PAS domain-containing protein
MAWADSIAKGRPFEYELRLRRHDGVYRWHLARWVPTRDAEGRVNGWYETSTDIHQRKQAEERLLESELRYRSTFENAAVGSAHFGLDGAFLRVNDRLCRMVGYACEELLATNWQAISHPTRSR